MINFYFYYGGDDIFLFVEAMRQFQFKIDVDNFALVHVCLGPDIHNEKTKPAQAAIKDLRSFGFTPDMIVYRWQEELEVASIEKIGIFCCDVDTQP